MGGAINRIMKRSRNSSKLDILEPRFHKVTDAVFKRIPRAVPGQDKIAACRLVAHRGIHLRKEAQENSLPAFQRALDLGIWGIEFDIRWTQDLKPMVFHDSDLFRIFGKPKPLATFTRKDLQRSYPTIPTLEAVVERFGGRLHLMIEIKAEDYPKPAYQASALQEILRPLEPGRDYHFMSLHPSMFRFAAFAPTHAMIPIPRLRLREYSHLARKNRYGGIAGHYLLLTNRWLQTHRQAGQQVGTGFPRSRNCLFREINRGVDWIFSDHAEALQEILQQHS